MKTLVVQSSVCSPGDKVVIHECTKSVRRWAESNNFDYVCMDESRNQPLSYWSDRLQIPEQHLNPTLSCLNWLDHPNHDRVVWVDGDIYAWDNPQIDDSWFSVIIQNNYHTLPYPQTGLFWGGEGVKSLAQWINDNVHANSEWVTYLRNYYKYNEGPIIGDQNIIQPWVGQHLHQITQLQLDSVHRRFIRNNYEPLSEPAEPNTFVHFLGNDRCYKYAMFLGIKEHYESLRRGRLSINPKEKLKAPPVQFLTRAQLAGKR